MTRVKRMTLFSGANGVGKTKWAVANCLSRILGYQPWDGVKHRQPPVRVLLCGPDFTNYHSKKSIPQIYEFLPRSQWESIKKNNNGTECEFTHPNGSILDLMSYEQYLRKPPDQASPFEGIDWDYANLDEPGPKDVYISISRGVMKRNGTMGWGMTPIAEPWVYDELYLAADDDPDIGAIMVPIESAMRSDTNPNGHLDEAAVAKYRNDLRGDDDEEARLSGKFVHLIGRIYRDFNKMVHTFKRSDIQIKAEWPKGISIDPHDKRPFAIIWWAVDEQGRRIIFKEWPTDPHKSYNYFDNRWDDYAEMIHKSMADTPGGRASYRWFVADPNFASTRKGATSQTLATFLQLQRLPFINDVDNSIPSGHQSIRRLLSWEPTKPVSITNTPHILVADDLWNVIWSFERYVWVKLEGDKEKPGEAGKDFMDCLRYMEAMRPRHLILGEVAAPYRRRGWKNLGLGALGDR
jgi:hypothetical protein